MDASFFLTVAHTRSRSKKIFDAAFLPKWNHKSGIFISNQKIQSLPSALADERFQKDFLRRCRERAAMT